MIASKPHQPIVAHDLFSLFSAMGPAEVAAWGMLGFIWDVFEHMTGKLVPMTFLADMHRFLIIMIDLFSIQLGSPTLRSVVSGFAWVQGNHTVPKSLRTNQCIWESLLQFCPRAVSSLCPSTCLDGLLQIQHYNA